MKIKTHNTECVIDVLDGGLELDECTKVEDDYVYIPYVIDMSSKTYGDDVKNVIELLVSSRMESVPFEISTEYAIVWIVVSPSHTIRVSMQFPKPKYRLSGNPEVQDEFMGTDDIEVELEDSETKKLVDIATSL